MADLDTIARIQIQATTDGVEASTAQLDQLTAAQDRLATQSNITSATTDTSAAKQLSAEAAYQRLATRIDSTYASSQAYAKGQGVLSAALNQGIIDSATYETRLGQLGAKFGVVNETVAEAPSVWRSFTDALGLTTPAIAATGVASEAAAVAHEHHSSAARELKEGMHTLDPAVKAVGGSIGALAGFTGAARGGIELLAIAMGVAFVATVANAGEQINITKQRLSEFFDSAKVGTSAFEGLDQQANQLGISVEGLIKPYESLIQLVGQLQQKQAGAGTVNPATTAGISQAAIDTITNYMKADNLAAAQISTDTASIISSMSSRTASTTELINGVTTVTQKIQVLDSQGFQKIIDSSPLLALALAKAFNYADIDAFKLHLDQTPISTQKVIDALVKLQGASKTSFDASRADGKTFQDQIDGIAASWEKLKTTLAENGAFTAVKNSIDAISLSIAGWKIVFDEVVADFKAGLALIDGWVSGLIADFKQLSGTPMFPPTTVPGIASVVGQGIISGPGVSGPASGVPPLTVTDIQSAINESNVATNTANTAQDVLNTVDIIRGNSALMQTGNDLIGKTSEEVAQEGENVTGAVNSSSSTNAAGHAKTASAVKSSADQLSAGLSNSTADIAAALSTGFGDLTAAMDETSVAKAGQAIGVGSAPVYKTPLGAIVPLGGTAGGPAPYPIIYSNDPANKGLPGYEGGGGTGNPNTMVDANGNVVANTAASTAATAAVTTAANNLTTALNSAATAATATADALSPLYRSTSGWSGLGLGAASSVLPNPYSTVGVPGPSYQAPGTSISGAANSNLVAPSAPAPLAAPASAPAATPPATASQPTGYYQVGISSPLIPYWGTAPPGAFTMTAAGAYSAGSAPTGYQLGAQYNPFSMFNPPGTAPGATPASVGGGGLYGPSGFAEGAVAFHAASGIDFDVPGSAGAGDSVHLDAWVKPSEHVSVSDPSNDNGRPLPQVMQPGPTYFVTNVNTNDKRSFINSEAQIASQIARSVYAASARR